MNQCRPNGNYSGARLIANVYWHVHMQALTSPTISPIDADMKYIQGKCGKNSQSSLVSTLPIREKNKPPCSQRPRRRDNCLLVTEFSPPRGGGLRKQAHSSRRGTKSTCAAFALANSLQKANSGSNCLSSEQVGGTEFSFVYHVPGP